MFFFKEGYNKKERKKKTLYSRFSGSLAVPPCVIPMSASTGTVVVVLAASYQFRTRVAQLAHWSFLSSIPRAVHSILHRSVRLAGAAQACQNHKLGQKPKAGLGRARLWPRPAWGTLEGITFSWKGSDSFEKHCYRRVTARNKFGNTLVKIVDSDSGTWKRSGEPTVLSIVLSMAVLLLISLNPRKVNYFPKYPGRPSFFFFPSANFFKLSVRFCSSVRNPDSSWILVDDRTILQR